MSRLSRYIPYEVNRSLQLILFSALFSGCSESPPSGTSANADIEPPMPEVVSGSEALQQPDIGKVDPGVMEQAEIDKVVPGGSRCSFAYTAESPPVLVGGIEERGEGARGVIKIHGRLVEVEAKGIGSLSELAEGATFAADGILIEVTPDAEQAEKNQKQSEVQWPADLHFTLDAGMRVGYRGWYTCDTH